MHSENLRLLLVEDNPGDVRLIMELISYARSGQIELQHVDQLKYCTICSRSRFFRPCLTRSFPT